VQFFTTSDGSSSDDAATAAAAAAALLGGYQTDIMQDGVHGIVCSCCPISYHWCQEQSVVVDQGKLFLFIWRSVEDEKEVTAFVEQEKK
jgi:hypothetical protein